jgi:hypothetical protein
MTTMKANGLHNLNEPDARQKIQPGGEAGQPVATPQPPNSGANMQNQSESTASNHKRRTGRRAASEAIAEAAAEGTLAHARILARQTGRRERAAGPPFSDLRSILPRSLVIDPNTDDGKAAMAELARQQAAVFSNAMAAAKVPPIYRPGGPCPASLAAPVPADLSDDGVCAWEKVRARMVKFLDAGRGVAGIVGKRGTGKTWFLSAMIHDAIQRRRTARYIKFMELVLALDAAGFNGHAHCLNSLVRPDVLAVDEMGEKPLTDIAFTRLILLVDMRYDAGKQTIMASNEKADVFAKNLGDSIASRIAQTGFIARCEWQSFRPQKIGSVG